MGLTMGFIIKRKINKKKIRLNFDDGFKLLAYANKQQLELLDSLFSFFKRKRKLSFKQSETLEIIVSSLKKKEFNARLRNDF